MWVDVHRLSNERDGDSEDSLPAYRDELGTVELRKGPVQLYLQHVPGEQGECIWKVSNATVARLPELYELYRYSAYVEWLFQNLPEASFLGIQLFKWVAAFSMAGLAAPFVLFLAWWIARLIVKPDRPIHRRVRRFLMGPVSALILVLVAARTLFNLGIGITAQKFTNHYTFSIIISIWLLWSGIDLAREAYRNHLIRQGREGSLALLRPMGSAIKAVFTLIAALVWLDNLGYQITALLTGLGVGGVAVAQVLQRPLEDVFGAVTLYTQQPVKIGDFGKFGDRTGTVEEISLRTTRIRTLDNTIIAVPNMRMASEPIENYSARQKILYQPTIRLTKDATPAQIQSLLEGVRKLLADDEQVLKEGARVRFTEIGGEAFELKVFAYVNLTDFPSYLEAAERLNFGILNCVDQVGAKLAIPIIEMLKAPG